MVFERRRIRPRGGVCFYAEEDETELENEEKI
jgi:hypothetical protein